MFDYYATKCSCGAITIQGKDVDEPFTNSMRPAYFKKHFRGRGYRFKWLNSFCCCDHCVNHWGLDICSCGSGEKVGKCYCKSKRPYQTVEVANQNSIEVILDRGSFA